MTIEEFIAAEAAKPFAWGTSDCASTADRWVWTQTGFSPLTAYGRVHKSEFEAREWLSCPGGLAVAVNRVMRACGFEKTKAPQLGDVGLVMSAGRLCVAIHAGRFWFSRDEDGLIGAPLDSVWKTWRIA